MEIVGLGADRQVVVTGTQAFHSDVPAAEAGMNVGLLLRGVRRDEVRRGQLIAQPGSLQPHQQGTAEIVTLTAEEGGRRKGFTTGYSPQFFFGATDVTGTIHCNTMIQPGDRATIDFQLGKEVGMEPGLRFALREGGRTIGAGVITEVA